MARANNGGWDFVKQGGIYQYKEDGLVAMVEILEEENTEEFYSFRLRVLAANMNMVGTEFNVGHAKDPGGFWSGMQQFYETPEYVMLPIGTPWKYALSGYETVGLEGFNKHGG